MRIKTMRVLLVSVAWLLMVLSFAPPANGCRYGECCVWVGEELEQRDDLCPGECCWCASSCLCVDDNSKCGPCEHCVDCSCEGYCDPDEHCCPDGVHCCPDGFECCNGLCCPPCYSCVSGECVYDCSEDQCCDNGTCVDECTSTGQCDYDEPDTSNYAHCENPDPIDKTCADNIEGALCGHSIIVSQNDAECADCAPSCDKHYVCACAQINPVYCQTTCWWDGLPPCACQCDDVGEPYYSGSHYECGTE